MRGLFLLISGMIAFGVVGPCWSAPPAITLTQLVTGVTNPVDIQSPKDGSGRLFVVERPGRIRIIQDGQLLATNYLDIAAQIKTGGEEGLLGLAFDPGFATNGHFFIFHTNNNGSSNVVDRYTAAPPSTNQVNQTTRTLVIEIPHPSFNNHNGGQLQFGPDGYLYIGTGDGGDTCDTLANGQNIESLSGKLLRLQVSSLPYAIPADNPFVGVPGRDEIWAYGLRNPWRFSFDRLTGDLIIADVGQGQREEVDFQVGNSPGGENYGWRCYEGTQTNTCNIAACTNNFPSIAPVLEFDHAGGKCSITGGYRYRGNQFPPLAGYYLYGDYCTGIIWAGSPDSNGVWSTTQMLDTSLNFSLVSFGEDQSGELYVADLTSNRVWKVVAVDTDTDGLPDWFEQTYFGNATAGLPTDDLDGDGRTNLEELQAGTSPADPASALRITHSEQTGGVVQIQFPSVLNRRYRVEFSNDVMVPPANVLTNNLVGNGGVITVTDATVGNDTNRFYRVRLLPTF